MVRVTGDDALTALSLRGRSSEDALTLVIDALDASDSLDGEICISVVSPKETRGQSLSAKLNKRAAEVSSAKGKDNKVSGAPFSKEEQKAAKEKNLSPAKYGLIRDVLEASDEGAYTFESLSGLSMKQLRDLYRALTSGGQGH